MIDKLLRIVAPHHCYNCGKTGYVLCQNCKYDIVYESNDTCILCLAPSLRGVCDRHSVRYSRAWFIGERVDTLESVIDAFKFDRVKSAGDELADMLDQRLPKFPANTVVVPVPTLSAHIRQRGYDHALLIARSLARKRSLEVGSIVERLAGPSQRGATRKERLKHAAVAYRLRGEIDPNRPYVIVDDIVTTGATVQSVVELLYKGGAKEVWVAVVARQPLDKQR